MKVSLFFLSVAFFSSRWRRRIESDSFVCDRETERRMRVVH